MTRKIKVSFEVTDNWKREDFRKFIRELIAQPTLYELFIISNDNTTAYINSVGQILGLDTAHTIVCSFTVDKTNAITSNEIDIHLDNLLPTTTLVDETTDADGIYVNELPNKYYLNATYIVEFGRRVDDINEESS